MIIVKYTSKLRLDLGRESDQFEAGSLAELLKKLERRHGGVFADWLPHCRIFVNGQSSVGRESCEVRLMSGDEVLFLLPVAGG